MRIALLIAGAASSAVAITAVFAQSESNDGSAPTRKRYPGSYEIYKTGRFPEGTIFFKELQLTLPAENPDGSRTEGAVS